MSERPTDKAIQDFGKAANMAYLAATMKDSEKLALAVNSLAAGLINMSKGMRATYILLEEVRGVLLRQNPTPPGTTTAAMRAVTTPIRALSDSER